nr:immunoglobulin heavy chain junction region [Mus musculus]
CARHPTGTYYYAMDYW